MERTIHNPIQKDTVVFLKTSADTQGAYTLVEVELADGGRVGLLQSSFAFRSIQLGRVKTWVLGSSIPLFKYYSPSFYLKLPSLCNS
jgi:hypothetical protein